MDASQVHTRGRANPLNYDCKIEGVCVKRDLPLASLLPATFVLALSRVNIVAVIAILVFDVGKTGRWTVG